MDHAHLKTAPMKQRFLVEKKISLRRIKQKSELRQLFLELLGEFSWPVLLGVLAAVVVFLVLLWH